MTPARRKRCATSFARWTAAESCGSAFGFRFLVFGTGIVSTGPILIEAAVLCTSRVGQIEQTLPPLALTHAIAGADGTPR